MEVQVIDKTDNAKTVKMHNIRNYSYSYSQYTGVHIVTAELHFRGVTGSKRSSNRNNTHKQ